MDNLFLLEDESYALLDYESDYRIGNKVKYAGYVLRLLRRLQKEGADIANLRIRIIVIYTADVTREQTVDMLNVGDIVICTTEGFLSEISSEEVKVRLQHKIEQKQSLDERDLMELIVLPLTYRGKERQQKAAHEAVDLAKEIRRCLSMTKVGAIIAREMEESEERGRRAGRVEGKAEGMTEGKAAGLSLALLTVLSSKGKVSGELEQKIQAQKESETLGQWIRMAAVAADVETFEEQIMSGSC